MARHPDTEWTKRIGTKSLSTIWASLNGLVVDKKMDGNFFVFIYYDTLVMDMYIFVHIQLI